MPVRDWKAERIQPISASQYPVKAKRLRDGRTSPRGRVALGDVFDRMMRA